MEEQVRREGSRWNPTKEQLRALEELYARGTRTPPAHQIQLIAAQLRRYGRIEGKNVFYWFQNHKARERQRLRRQAEEAAATAASPSDHKQDSGSVIMHLLIVFLPCSSALPRRCQARSVRTYAEAGKGRAFAVLFASRVPQSVGRELAGSPGLVQEMDLLYALIVCVQVVQRQQQVLGSSSKSPRAGRQINPAPAHLCRLRLQLQEEEERS